MSDGSTSGDPAITTTVTFSDNSNSFSIRCGKCADIHNAQLDGKTQKSCECDCHDKISQPYVPYMPYCPPDPCCPTWPQPYYTTPITGDPPTLFYTTYCTDEVNCNGAQDICCTFNGTMDNSAGAQPLYYGANRMEGYHD